MQDLQKLQSLRKSGRFQCDLFFYTKLIQLLTHLNLYQQIPQIQKNKQIIQKTTQLTKQHLIALQHEDDQQKALSIIKQINKQVLQLNTKCVAQIFGLIYKMNGKSYEDKVIAYVKGQNCKKLYVQIYDKINNNVHDPVLRLNDMILVAIFVKENGEKLGQFVEVFGCVIENGIQQLRSFKANQQFIQNNPQIQQIPKVKAYAKGSHIIIKTLQKFNQIYKLISNINKYSIKLLSIKKDIQKQLNIEPTHGHHGHHEQSIRQFKKYLLEGGDIPKFCTFCLGVGGDHLECKNVIKLLFRKKEEKKEEKKEGGNGER